MGDTELELIDLYRNYIRKYIGDVTVADGWKVQRLSSSEFLVLEGDSWIDGIPFQNRGANDELVSLGYVDPALSITLTDYIAGSLIGKKLTIASGSTGTYQVVVTAEEQIVFSDGPGIVDPFLKNFNVPETTANKFRTLYKINVLLTSDQTATPTPYRGFNSPSNVDYFNYITVVSSSIAFTHITDPTQQMLDGRTWDITVANPSNRFPTALDDQAEFADGKLIDNNGNRYHLISIRNGNPGNVVLRVDSEVGQAQPVLAADGTTPFYLYKQDLFYADISTGVPQGKLAWPIANITYSGTNGIVHSSSIEDLRPRVLKDSDFKDIVNAKFSIKATGGGSFSWQCTYPPLVTLNRENLLVWASAVSILNPAGATQTINAGTQALLDGGFLVYNMDLTGGVISSTPFGVQTVSSTGNVLTFSSDPGLDSVRIGNVVYVNNSPSNISYVESVDTGNKTITLNSSIGSGSIDIVLSLDSFAPGLAPVNENSFVLAARSGTKVYLCDGTELEATETVQMGDGTSSATFRYIGATDELDSDPLYLYTNYIVQGSPLVTAVGRLDLECKNIHDIMEDARVYDERILYPSGLAASTPIHIPVNSRLAATQQTFLVERSQLEIDVNQLFKYQGTDASPADWTACDSGGTEILTGVAEYIRFNFALANDSEVHFRFDTLGGVTGAGSSTTLQDAYNNGATVTIATGVPIEISGPIGEKLLEVHGDMSVDGVVDPKGVELTKEASNPLGVGKSGLWINSSDELIQQAVAGPSNISHRIDNLEAGFGVTALGVVFHNASGSTINKFTPVYSPTVGNIDIADGTDDVKSRVVGITAADIGTGTDGTVIIIGRVDITPTALTHGRFIYLGLTPGSLVDVAPSLVGGYPVGFDVILVGVLVGTELILRFQHVGTL